VIDIDRHTIIYQLSHKNIFRIYLDNIHSAYILYSMQLEAPKIERQRVYVIARDPETGESKSMTLYECTPEEVLEAIRAMAIAARQAKAEQVAN
jgi:hypothetical protein